MLESAGWLSLLQIVKLLQRLHGMHRCKTRARIDTVLLAAKNRDSRCSHLSRGGDYLICMADDLN